MTRPTVKPEWATSNAALVGAPTTVKQKQGWIVEKPPLQYFNWWQREVFKWVNHLDEQAQIDAKRMSYLASIFMGTAGDLTFASNVLTWASSIDFKLPGLPSGSNVLAAGSLGSVVPLADGDILYVDLNIPKPICGDTTLGSPTIINATGVDDVVAGMVVFTASFPDGTEVLSVDIAARTITFDDNATATVVQEKGFVLDDVTVTAGVVTEDNFVAAPNRLIFARVANGSCYVGCGTGLTMYRAGDKRALFGVGEYYRYSTLVAGENINAHRAVYVCGFSTGIEAGRTIGRAYYASSSSSYNGVRAQPIGFALNTVTAGADVLVQTEGRYFRTPTPGNNNQNIWLASSNASDGTTAITPERTYSGQTFNCKLGRVVRGDGPTYILIEITYMGPVQRQLSEDRNLGLTCGLTGVFPGPYGFKASVVIFGGAYTGNPINLAVCQSISSSSRQYTPTEWKDADTEILVPAGATLGHAAGVDEPVYVYAIYDSPAVRIGISTTLLDSRVTHNATAISNASNSRTTLYATAGASNVIVEVIGKLNSNQTIAGSYAAGLTIVQVPRGITDSRDVETPAGLSIGSIIQGGAKNTSNLTSGANRTIQSVDIPPGAKAIVYASLGTNTAGTTVVSNLAGYISLVNNTNDEEFMTIYHRGGTITGGPANGAGPIPPRHVFNNTSSPITVYLVAYCVFTTSTVGINATRSQIYAVVVG